MVIFWKTFQPFWSCTNGRHYLPALRSAEKVFETIRKIASHFEYLKHRQRLLQALVESHFYMTMKTIRLNLQFPPSFYCMLSITNSQTLAHLCWSTYLGDWRKHVCQTIVWRIYMNRVWKADKKLYKREWQELYVEKILSSHAHTRSLWSCKFPLYSSMFS